MHPEPVVSNPPPGTRQDQQPRYYFPTRSVVVRRFLTVITATITTAFVESTRSRIEATRTDTTSAKLDQIAARLEVIEAGLRSIGGHDSDAPH
ncbi:MAG TPA: hypothetical protein VKG38_07030 [Solirubrobacteraceae bacterium]|nr:hypothetical protein [Solirubrobacteraceae bacterium]